jgi:hypothetical protein
MADVSISGLNAASGVSGADVLPMSQSGTTNKVSAAQLQIYLNAISQGGTLTSALNLGGHVLEVASPGDVIVSFGVYDSLIGMDYNYNPYLETSQGYRLGFDPYGNVTFAGFSIYTEGGYFLYATGNTFADRNGNIYYNTTHKLADNSGNLYLNPGGLLYDSANSSGTAGYFLSNNGSGKAVWGPIAPVQAITSKAPAYSNGALYFDTTLNKLRVGGASGWETVTSA